MITITKINTLTLTSEKMIEMVLEKRGLNLEINEFVSPSDNHEIHYSKLKNIEEAVDVLVKHLEDDSKILIVPDRDIDGLTSAAALQKYLQDDLKYENVSYIHHLSRQNGLTETIMNEINSLEEKPDLVIMPDASSNDFTQHESLYFNDIDVIVLDHHEAIRESEYATVVNPQLSPEYENKQLSGVGVVYKFLQACDHRFGINKADKYLDLVAFGNISDGMDMSSMETRYYVYKGLSNVQNRFLTEAFDKWIDGRERPSPNKIAWNVSPKVNALIRVGKQEEYEELYNALLGVENTQKRESKYRGKVTIVKETTEQRCVRLCTNAHSRSKTVKKNANEELMAIVEKNNLNDYPFILITAESLKNEGMNGYLASGLVNIYNKPVIITVRSKSNPTLFNGSIRGYDPLTTDFKSYLESTGLVEYVMGHGQAAGISIKEENIQKLKDKSLEDFTQEQTYSKYIPDYDFIISNKGLTDNLAEIMDELYYLWGKGVDEPIFKIEDVELSDSIVKVGAAKTDILLNNFKGLSFKNYKIFDELEEKNAIVNLYGTVNINRFFSSVDNQVMIDYIDLKELKEKPQTPKRDYKNLF